MECDPVSARELVKSNLEDRTMVQAGLNFHFARRMRWTCDGVIYSSPSDKPRALFLRRA